MGIMSYETNRSSVSITQDVKYTMQHDDSLWLKIRPLLSQVSWTHALFYATCVRM